jgi:hypothetical protein
MEVLNKSLINRKDFRAISGLEIGSFDTYPEKVLQFGEGNFLRGFVDWMFNRLNSSGMFNGSVVVVQPITGGLIDAINRQDEPCPRCGTPIARVDFDEHTIYYCPTCQTGGRILKDRRLSRLLR